MSSTDNSGDTSSHSGSIVVNPPPKPKSKPKPRAMGKKQNKTTAQKQPKKSIK